MVWNENAITESKMYLRNHDKYEMGTWVVCFTVVTINVYNGWLQIEFSITAWIEDDFGT